MEDVGYLKRQGDRYEFHYPELGLVVRGPFAEWVMESAAEIIAHTAEIDTRGTIEELRMLVDFGEADEIAVDAAQYDAEARFEAIPQCVVSMGEMDYHWVAPAGRDGENGEACLRRIHVMSRTRNDTFLKNVDGVDTSGT